MQCSIDDFISTPNPIIKLENSAHTYICCFFCLLTCHFNCQGHSLWISCIGQTLAFAFTFNLSASEHKKGASDVERIRGVINLDWMFQRVVCKHQRSKKCIYINLCWIFSIGLFLFAHVVMQHCCNVGFSANFLFDFLCRAYNLPAKPKSWRKICIVSEGP